MRPTRFNQARSSTRLLDHAAFGAAGLYSDTAPFSGLIAPGKDGILVDRQEESWITTIRELTANPALRRELAAGGQATAARIGAQERVQQFWRSLLGF